MLAAQPLAPTLAPLPAALLDELVRGPVMLADDPCLAAAPGADPESANRYYRARYYDPTIGRFLSEDPVGLREGPNFYAYVHDNPINKVDPSGKWTDAEQSFCSDPRNWKACRDIAVCAAIATYTVWGTTWLGEGRAPEDDSPENARKHCMWSCCSVRVAGSLAAYELTTAHEKNPADRCQTDMDMANNASGMAYGSGNGGDCWSLCDPKNLRCKPRNPPCKRWF